MVLCLTWFLRKLIEITYLRSWIPSTGRGLILATVKALGSRAVPPELRTHLPQWATHKKPSAPGDSGSRKLVFSLLRALVSRVREQMFDPPFSLYGGLTCDVAVLMSLSLWAPAGALHPPRQAQLIEAFPCCPVTHGAGGAGCAELGCAGLGQVINPRCFSIAPGQELLSLHLSWIIQAAPLKPHHTLH